MKSALLLFALSALSPAFASDQDSALLEDASARRGCGAIRLVSTEGRECIVSFFPDRVGAKARFSCGEDVFACACTEAGPTCARE